MEGSGKSRASFVDQRRKSLTLNNIFVDENQEKSKAEKPEHSLKSYLESLKKEKEDWDDILREKKSKYKDYKEQSKAAPMTITKVDVEKFISQEDQQFLKEKPNYLEMLKSVRKYIDAVNYLNKYKSDVIDHYEKACNELEIDKKILVEEMCASSLCEICNIKHCQKPEHKFFT